MSPDAIVGEAIVPLLNGRDRPLVLGLSGSQGSGKSTLAARFPGAAVLSLDDLYLGRRSARDSPTRVTRCWRPAASPAPTTLRSGWRRWTRFVAHYERLTRHCLATVPEQADMALFLDEERRVERVNTPRTRSRS